MAGTVASEALDRLDAIRDLPTLPVVAQQVSAAVRSSNSDAGQIARLIEDDPAIMTRVLKVVNSALYGAGEEITSVQQAVTRLGMRAVGAIAMTTSVFSAFGKGDSLFDREAFWRHSITTGIAATVIHDRCRQYLLQRWDASELRLAGLLHDIGKIIFDQYFQDEFAEAIRISRTQKVPLLQAEMQMLELDHALAGGWLAAKWKLSDGLLHAIRWHHSPGHAPEKYWEMVALCHVADHVCKIEGIGDGGDSCQAFDETVWKRLCLSVADIPEVLDRVREASAKSEILMNLIS